MASVSLLQPASCEGMDAWKGNPSICLYVCCFHLSLQTVIICKLLHQINAAKPQPMQTTPLRGGRVVMEELCVAAGCAKSWEPLPSSWDSIFRVHCKMLSVQLQHSQSKSFTMKAAVTEITNKIESDVPGWKICHLYAVLSTFYKVMLSSAATLLSSFGRGEKCSTAQPLMLNNPS